VDNQDIADILAQAGRQTVATVRKMAQSMIEHDKIVSRRHLQLRVALRRGEIEPSAIDIKNDVRLVVMAALQQTYGADAVWAALEAFSQGEEVRT
jgi:hypothetical protein